MYFTFPSPSSSAFLYSMFVQLPTTHPTIRTCGTDDGCAALVAHCLLPARSPGNGHLKVRPHLCIHPRHLAPSSTLVNYGALLGPLVKMLIATGMLDPDPAIIRDLQSLGWAGHHFELVRTDKPLRVFDTLMERIRVLCKPHPPLFPTFASVCAYAPPCALVPSVSAGHLLAPVLSARGR